MSDPTPPTRDRSTSSSTPSWLRRRHWKDGVIELLGLLLATSLAYGFREEISGAFKRPAKGEEVSVFDVVLDREGRAFVDVLFDKPLGEGKVGEVLDPAPAKLEPALGGFWKWQDTNALRFQPTSGFPVASRYEITLDTDRLLRPGQSFKGKKELEVVTDRFLVEGIDVTEEPALEGKGQVILRGTFRFNYDVSGEVLATKVKLVDPTLGEDKPIDVELEISWQASEIGFRTGPVQKGDDERKLRLVISRDLVPAEGNVPLGTDYVQEVPLGSRLKLAVWKVETEPGDRESTIRLHFSSPISASVAEKYLTIEPKVDYRPSAERNILSLTGAFRPGATYKLRLGKGLPATDDASLQEDWESDVSLPNLEPRVGFESQGMFLSAAGYHTVALETVNVDKVQMSIDRVYLNNLFFLFQYGGFFGEETTYPGSEVHHALGNRVADETLDVRSRPNQRVRTPMTLDRYVPKGKPGLYRVVVSKPDAYEGAQRWVLLTDLGAVAKRGDGEFLVWVSSFRDLSAVEGAKVTLLSNQNQTIAEGRTDGSGLIRLKDEALAAATDPARRQEPYMVTIEKGSDFSFLLLDTMRVDSTGLDVGGAEPLASGYTAFLYGERDIYRPGETVEGLAVVRDFRLQPAPAMPVRLRWRDPQGRERGTQRLTLDNSGHSPFHLALPAYALTGGHTLELLAGENVLGQYRFQVEEFVPDRIKVEITPPKAPVGPGQELAYDVSSIYLFGPPAASLPVESRVRLVDSTFAPKGYEAFSFRNDERQIDDREVLSEDSKLDDAGRATFRAAMPAGTPVPSSLEAVLTARVQEQGGRGVAALARVPVHPYPYYLGLRRLGEGYPERGQEVKLEYAAVAPDGTPAKAGALRAELYRDRWNTVLRRSPSGGFNYETTRDPQLIDSRAVSGGEARGTFSFKPSQFGSYRVVVTDPATQASSQAEFYVSGYGYSPWAIKNPARLELALDKEEYAPGETARLQVRAPFAGKLLLTVERSGVLYTAVHTLTGNTATLDVPVEADYRPNAYVTATLVRAVGDLEAGSVGRAFGAVPISVDRTANRLAVEITTLAQVRPNTTLTIGVKTAPGSIVTVAAVDEGILQLISQKTPQPFDFFYRKLALGVTSYDTFSLLLPEVKPQGGPTGGGEGAEGMGQHVRTEGIRRVEPVAFWSGPVEVDAQGNAKVSFQLPEFQGALRIMVVAIHDDQFGSAEAMTRVRDPIVLLPTLPRILSLNEVLQVPLTVRNDTGRDGTIRVALATQGPAQVEKAQAVQSIAIPNGREKTAYFTVKTGNASGDVRFTATAEGNGERSRSTAVVGVRPDLPAVTGETSGALDKATSSFPLADAGNYRPETLRRELRLGPVPVVQFSGKLRDLLRYPYGCIEQTVSTAFPLLYLGDLAKQLDPDLFKKGDPAVYVQEALSRMATMQLFGGGFSLWPGGESVHPWGTVYATHFLVEARRAGHPVEDFLYDGALRYLAGEAKAKAAYGSEELERTVYALYVLARAGRADLGTMDFLREKHKQSLRPESRALLGAAYAAVGNPRALQELVSNLAQVEEIERQTGGNLGSTIRNRAIVLAALLDATPNSPQIPRLVDRLARDSREVTAWTTQETGWAMIALGQLYRRQTQAPPYIGTVYLGDRKVGTFSNKATTFANLQGTGPLRIVMGPGYRPNAAYFSVLTRGIPTDEAFKPENAGLEIERQILDRNGNAVDLAEVKQGDLLVVKTRVRSTLGPVLNVVVENLLPSGLEVENPRLTTTETLPWVTDANTEVDYLDLRDDRILLFVNLPKDSWLNAYALVRAVAPGSFRVPPPHAEAMYNPALRATGARGRMEVKLRQ